MAKLSTLAETLIGSEIVKLGNAINDRIKAGEKIYNYTIGDFNPQIFPIPSLFEQYIIDAYKDGFTNYPPGDGVFELRQAVSKFLKHWGGLDYNESEIQIASGGRPLIYTIFRTLIDDGDKIIYAAPSWNNNHYTHLTNAKHCVINCTVENDFMPTPADIAAHINGATLLCLCTPQNPTGTTLSKESLSEICDLIVAENEKRTENEKKLYVMFDQMYWTLTFGKTQHYNPVTINPKMKDYTIFVDGISKAFSATGVRVGWSFGPAHIIAKMKAILSHVGAWAPMAEQKATAKYLLETENIENYFLSFKSAIELRLNKLYNGIKSLQEKGFDVDAINPQAAIYLTLKFDLVGKTTHKGVVLSTQAEVTQFILSEAKLAIVPFSAFGAEPTNPWYRLSVGVVKLEDIENVIHLLENALKQLH